MGKITSILCSLCVSLLVPSLAQANTYNIKHIEPLSWWIGMKHPELQLMVHADNIAESTPEIQYHGVTLVNVERTNNKNFLFINLLIDPDTQPGTVNIVFKRDNNVIAKAEYQLEARIGNSAERRGFDAQDAVYLITPDRFANGNPHNDTMPGMHDIVDRKISIARHGGDIKGMQDHLDYIASLGFTMIWPTPLLENNQEKYSYHGYSLTNYYLIDSRFGTNKDYKNFVAAANKKGMGVIQDIVLNHIGTGHWWMNDLPAADWLNYQSGFVPTNNQHTTIQDQHAAPEEREQFLNGWFVDSMPDMNQRNPLVARYLIQNSIWWIEYANLSGFREDTYSYSDTQFLKTWSDRILDEYPHFNIVGEEMNDNPHIVAYWQKGVKNRDGYESGLPSLMDFPVVDLMPNVLNDKENYDSGLIKLYEMIASDFVYANPMNLMVFPDNHDRSRIFSLLHENVNLLKSSLLFTATTRGIPQIYYGTEILTTSPIERDDGLLRADFPGGWSTDTINGFTGKGLSAAQRDVQLYLKKLFNWRKQCSVISNGKLLHYIPHDGTYVYFRYNDAHTLMVIINKNTGDSQLDLHRFSTMIKNKTRGKNIITDQIVDLTQPLTLNALTSIAIEW